MQIPLQITVRDIEHTAELEAHIRNKANKLGEVFDRIMSCHIVVEMPHKHQHQGKQFNVRIDITVPGNEIVINHDHHEDVYLALRDAFDTAKRRLEDYARIIRGDVKKHEARQQGETEGLPEE